MSVGKESIKRAANEGTKKSTGKEPAEEIKAAAENKAAEPGTAAAKKTSRTKAAPARRTAAKTAKAVKTSVLTPENADEIQAKFLSDGKKDGENESGPVHITEELPVYLL